jgi:hypothetical protein
MEAFAAAAAPAAGVFAGSGTVARRFILRRNLGVSRYGAARLLFLWAPPPRVGGDGGDLPPLDKWDMMELNFGRFLGEDPKLTLAKVLPPPLFSYFFLHFMSFRETASKAHKTAFFKKFGWNPEYHEMENCTLVQIFNATILATAAIAAALVYDLLFQPCYCCYCFSYSISCEQ